MDPSGSRNPHLTRCLEALDWVYGSSSFHEVFRGREARLDSPAACVFEGIVRGHVDLPLPHHPSPNLNQDIAIVEFINLTKPLIRKQLPK